MINRGYSVFKGGDPNLRKFRDMISSGEMSDGEEIKFQISIVKLGP
jgi:hypothetical protein